MNKMKIMAGLLSAAVAFSYIPQLAANAAETVNASAKIQTGVNFRDKPSASSSVKRFLREDEVVTVLEKVNSNWYKVKDKNGKEGYVSTKQKYIKFIAGTNQGANTKGNNQNGGAAKGSDAVENTINAGMKYLGTPYVFGSSRSDTSTFDCSDFVKQAFKEGASVELPSNSRKQGDYVKDKGHNINDWRQLKRGDLMFFMSYKGSKASDYADVKKETQRITHVAIYLGDGQVLHTYSEKSGGVRTDSIEGKAWEHRFLFGGSAL